MSNKITEEIREQLRAPFPPEAISQHPTKTYLSTIKAIFIVERLNDIFGISKWTVEHEIVSDTPEYVTVKGRLVIFEPWNIMTPYQYGGHGKTGKNTEPADGYKSSVTDCLSKCASYFELGIDVFKGLAGCTPKKKYTPKTGGQATTNLEDTPEAKRLTALKNAEPALYKQACTDKKIKPEKVLTLGETKTVLQRATALWQIEQAKKKV